MLLSGVVQILKSVVQRWRTSTETTGEGRKGGKVCAKTKSFRNGQVEASPRRRIRTEHLTAGDAGDKYNNSSTLLVAHIHSLHGAACENIRAWREVRARRERPSEWPPGDVGRR